MIPEWLQLLTQWLGDNPGWLAAALFLVAFLESLAIAGIVIPGVAIIFAVAALAGKTGMPLFEALIWAGLGAIAGDLLSFGLGRMFQGRLHSIWPFSRYPSFVTKGERFFYRHGGKSVVIGRFVGPIRPVIPMVAGALLMPWRRFVLFNLLSAIGWAPVYILPGYLVGSALASDVRLPPHFYPILGISIAALTLVYLVIFRFQLGLGTEGRLYRLLARHMEGYSRAHRIWRLYSSQRPASNREFPLPSLILAVGAGSLFLVWAILTTATDLLTSADILTRDWFTALRNPLLDPAMIFFTLSGDMPVLVAGALIGAAVLGLRGYYAAAVHVLLALALAAGLIWAGKYGFGVHRPTLVNAPPDSGAFPSGHAAGITVLAGLLASFIARERPSARRWLVYLVFSFPMVLVGLSRVYLGVHWMTDVVGGVALGLAVCGLVRASYSRHDQVPLSLEPVAVTGLLAWLAFAGSYIALHWDNAIIAYRLASV